MYCFLKLIPKVKNILSKIWQFILKYLDLQLNQINFKLMLKKLLFSGALLVCMLAFTQNVDAYMIKNSKTCPLTVTITLSGPGCTSPTPFSLAPGASVNYTPPVGCTVASVTFDDNAFNVWTYNAVTHGVSFTGGFLCSATNPDSTCFFPYGDGVEVFTCV
jgi:hypothetical protein